MPPYVFAPAQLILGLIACIVVLFVAAIFCEYTWHDFRRATSRRTRIEYGIKVAVIFILTLVVGGGAVNGISFAAAHSHNWDASNATSWDVAESFGLKSDEAYPLVLGDRIDGSIGTGIGGKSFFRSRVAITPGSALSVSFVHQEKSYLLEIPVARSTFIQSETEKPSVTLRLNNWENPEYGVGVRDASRPCKPVIEGALLMCRRIITSSAPITEATTHRGLSALIADANILDSAVFVVTPKMYREIMGKNG